MQQGTVKWFNEAKGFGFINSDNKQYFVHFSEIQKTGYKTLAEGERVTFTVGAGAKGPVAKDVRNIEE